MTIAKNREGRECAEKDRNHQENWSTEHNDQENLEQRASEVLITKLAAWALE
jgi:hypothetical protein